MSSSNEKNYHRAVLAKLFREAVFLAYVYSEQASTCVVVTIWAQRVFDSTSVPMYVSWCRWKLRDSRVAILYVLALWRNFTIHPDQRVTASQWQRRVWAHIREGDLNIPDSGSRAVGQFRHRPVDHTAKAGNSLVAFSNWPVVKPSPVEPRSSRTYRLTERPLGHRSIKTDR